MRPRVLTFDIMLPRVRYASEQQVATYHDTLAGALQALPEIEVVSAANSTPLDGNDGCTAVFMEGRPLAGIDNPPCVDTPRVAPGYFDVLRIPVRGRAPDRSETGDSGAVVSEALARRLWPGEEAIGKGIRVNGDGPPYYRVIGVAGDVRRNGFEKPPAETVYFPIRSRDGAPLCGAPRAMRVVIRTRTANAGDVVPQVRPVLASLDPTVPMANVRILTDVVSESMAQSSFTTTLLMLAAFLAVVLSAVGLYGVIAYGVMSRQSELGVRLALGARPGVVRLMLVREVLLLVLAGLSIGTVAALSSTRWIAGLLYGVTPHDPATYVSVTAFLLGVGLVAGFVPAWRGSQVDPLIALRSE